MFMKTVIFAILATALLAEGHTIHYASPAPIPNTIPNLCAQNGVNASVIEHSALEFATCVEEKVQMTALQNELKNAFTANDSTAVNGVLKKYCPKSPQLKGCYHAMLETSGLCLGADKKDFVKLTLDIYDRLLDYACERDGEVVAQFIVSGGPQCFTEHIQEIGTCAQSSQTLLTNVAQNLNLASVKNVYDEALNCINRSVEKCLSPAASAIVNNVIGIFRAAASEAVSKSAQTGGHPDNKV